ncbi:hypothetical protein [Enemella evansiae]|uniref:hypothetical protein n=1 Tax=Enemella evansiae TaxID=2016499 RepID=UPI000B97B50E|nr:hypothetical protein [Enemella evansiae]OYN94044.1 hypothetical protein CGZ96_19450 [Enemella evansiae]OYN95330.1 hypothetical protein CGZ95_16470 [Enemella evansiae]OYO03432.1 hypothetical protein CGZ97_08235 [Enemella evansiae]OYO09852.1 hypothetical protein CGZ98_12035 [Enemella evansiae]
MQSDPLQPLKMTVGTLAAGCVIIGVVASMVMPAPEEPASLGQQVLPILLPLITAAVGWAFLRRPPAPTGDQDTGPQAMAALRSRTTLAAAVTEAGGFLAFAFGYVFEFPPLAVTIALVLAGVLVLAVAWPRMSRLEEWEREMRRQVRR